MTRYNGYSAGDLKRAQRRGRAPRKVSRRAEVLMFLAHRPATSRAIAAALDLDPWHMSVLGNMANYGKLAIIGTVEQALLAGIDFDSGMACGQRFLRRTAGVYAAPGTPLLPKAPAGEPKHKPQPPTNHEPRTTSLTIAGGAYAVAGRITIPQYRYFGAQFRRAEG